MNTRKYGRAGIEVSEIGMGGHREGFDSGVGLARGARFFLPDKERTEIVARAIDSGVTYFDTTYGCELVSLGSCLHEIGKRDGLFISGMRVDFFQTFLDYGREHFSNDIRKYTRLEVDARLKEGRLEWLDQFLLGALDQGDPLSHQSAMEDAVYELERLTESGKIRYYGFSCHDANYAADLLDTYPVCSVVMVPYNFANRMAEESLQEKVIKHNTAWIAMKALVWEEYGIPVTAFRKLKPVNGWPAHNQEAPVGGLSLRWILQNKYVTTVVPAMNTAHEIDENTAPRNALDEEEIGVLQEYGDAMKSGDFIPLGIAGIASENLRIQGHGLRVLNSALNLSLPSIDWDTNEAPEQAAGQVRRVLETLKRHRDWAEYVRTAL